MVSVSHHFRRRFALPLSAAPAITLSAAKPWQADPLRQTHRRDQAAVDDQIRNDLIRIVGNQIERCGGA